MGWRRSGSSPADSIPRTFERRTARTVLLTFLVTMSVFLWAAYSAERSLHYEEAFEHLEETSAVVALLPDFRGHPTPGGLATIEERLGLEVGALHRVVVSDSDFSILAASGEGMVDTDIRQRLELKPWGARASGRAVGKLGNQSWLAASRKLNDGRWLFLMRSKSESEQFARRFWELHGLHIAVTLLLFLLLMRFLGDRHVRRPIERLSAHIRRIEHGEFETRPEEYGHDEFGWLAERFTRMGLRLKETVERLVRSEKLAAASAVAYQVAREAMTPLSSFKRHVTYLEGLAGDDPELRAIAGSLERDRRKLVLAIVRLEKLADEPEAPGEGSSGSTASLVESAEEP